MLDSSWSMLAKTHGRETRWDRAIAEARRIAASSDQVAIATTADGLVQGLTDDSVLVEAALARLAPRRSLIPRGRPFPACEAVHFITDGAVAHHLDQSSSCTRCSRQSTMSRLPHSTCADARGRRARPGRRKSRAPISRSRTSRKTADRPHHAVARQDAGRREQHVSRAGEAYRQIVPLTRQGDPALHAHVDAPENALDVDDDGFAWIARAPPLAVRWLAIIRSGSGGCSPTTRCPRDLCCAGGIQSAARM